MSLAGKQVLVTGSAGFLGSALVQRLAAEGATIRALVRRPDRAQHLLAHPGVSLFQGDITNPGQMQAAVEGCEIIFHVAAALGGTLAAQLETNLGGTRNLAQAAVHASVKRLVHVSSIAVYGYRIRGEISEDTPCDPGQVPYNISKREAEQILLQTADQHALEWSIIRPGMIYGPRSGFWTDKLARLAKLRPTPFIGDGSGTAHLIYVDDVIDLMIHQATHPAAARQIFHCVTDPAPTWRAFLGEYMKLAGHNQWRNLPAGLALAVAPLLDAVMHLRGEPQDLADIIPYALSSTQFSMKKAADLLGWQPHVSLAEGIQRCLPYLQETGVL